MNHTRSSHFQELEQLSTEQLEMMIRLDCCGAAPLETETILAITEILSERRKAENNTERRSAEDSYLNFLARLDSNTHATQENPLTSSQPDSPLSDSSLPESKKNTTSQLMKAQIYTKIIAASLVFVFIAGMAPAAFGVDNVFTILGKWTDSVFSFIKDPVFLSDTEKNLDDLSSVVNVMCNTTGVVPSWLPEEYSLSILESYSDKECASVFADFVAGEKAISLQFSSIYDGAVVNYEKDAVDVEIYTLENQDHYIMRNDDLLFCVWATEKIECHIYGDMTYEELLLIIDSIYKK